MTRTGDVANKIGTYLKALAAHDNGVPFWVGAALDHDRLDVSRRGARHPDRGTSATEVTDMTGRAADGADRDGAHDADRSAAANPAFDVTPARLVTGLITERGALRGE